MSDRMFDTRTTHERRLGRHQMYVHAGPWVHHYGGKNRLPADFNHTKPVRRVRGGRWYVRKLAHTTKDGWQWHAYNKNSGKGLSARFPTQQMAVDYAFRMARLAKDIRK